MGRMVSRSSRALEEELIDEVESTETAAGVEVGLEVVGLKEGSPDGRYVGMPVGRSVGELEGAPVGGLEGVLDGAPVG